jgi:hypothetical protein
VRDPALLYKVALNLLNDITLAFPNYALNPINQRMTIEFKHFDTSAPGAEGSFIMALIKQPI